MTRNAAVVGYGYWGKNLVRVMHEMGALAVICDRRRDARDEAEAKYGIPTTSSFEEVLNDPAIEGVMIAAPAAQHYEMAKQALLSGKHVFVEKPLALEVRDGEELVELATRSGRTLMVGHILEYHPAVRELKRLVREGELGRVQYIYSSRLNIGKLRTEENILWSFAPHDIAVILSLLKEYPERVAAHGGCYISPTITDTTLTTCEFRSGVRAHIFVSWLHPFKEQKLCVVGDRNMAVFDDTEQERKLTLYPHRIEWKDRIPVVKKNDGVVIDLPKQEPLKEECRHFLDCIAEGKWPITDGPSALQVLRVLHAAEQSLKASGAPVDATPVVPKYKAHPSAVIDGPCEIGAGTKIWHFSHIMAHSSIGERCNLGQNVLVSNGVRIGNNVKIQNNVSLYTGVELEDDVFCGPSMVFTNVINPRSHIVRKNEYRQTLVKRGASLGANCTIVCGTTIGEYAFVAAGAVVNRDVKPHALVMGVPARQVGWMCYCGVRLPESEQISCSACGREYSIEAGKCKPCSYEMSQGSARARAAAVALGDRANTAAISNRASTTKS